MAPHTHPARLATVAPLALVLVAVVVAYAPGLDGPFVLDDGQRILAISSVAVTEPDPALLADALRHPDTGSLRRGLPRLTFAVDHLLAGGFEPRRFKVTNLCIHLSNTVLVFALVLAAARSGRLDPRLGRHLPWLAAAVWALHPLQLTAVLYVVQRHASLAAFWVLAGLLVYLRGRTVLATRRGPGLALMAAGVGGGTALGLLCKENAVLLPALALVVELGCLDRRMLDLRSRRVLVGFHVVAVVLPAVAVLALLAARPGVVLDDYAFRDFGPGERLLTEARALFYYLGLMAWPRPAELGLFHDDFVSSRSLLEPATTVVALGTWIALAVAACSRLPRGAPWAFAVVWFLVGHAVESGILALEPVFEHRNYLPSVGPAYACAFYLLRGVGALGAGARFAVPAGVAIAGVLALSTHARATHWSTADALMAAEARGHPDSYRALVGLAGDGLPRDWERTYELLARAAQLRPRAILPAVRVARLEAARAPSAEALAPSLEALDAEISRRLGARSYLAEEDVVALADLARCVYAGRLGCRRLLDAAVTWHDLALIPAASRPRLAAALELSLAGLHATAGRDGEAVHHARRAGELAPGNPSYRLEELGLYAALDRWDQVERVLAELDGGPHRDRFRGRRFARLRQDLAAQGPTLNKTD